MSSRGFLLAVALAVVASVTGLIAAASHVAVPDADDTRGLLDISAVRMRGDEEPKWKVTTYRRWRIVDIFDIGFGFIHFDSFGSSRFDYYALIRSNGFRLKAMLYRDRIEKRDYAVADLDVWRSDRRSFTVRVPLRLLRVGTGRAAYGWQAQTAFTSRRCRRVCFDLAPDTGSIVEPLPAPLPTATPSPTPSSS